jgi:hypothetical protein
MAKTFKLKDSRSGCTIATVTREEIKHMRANGKRIEKTGKDSFSLLLPPDPSNSRDSATCLTGGNRIKGDGGDMFELAGRHFEGGRLPARKRERLIGWGLITPKYA